MFRYCRNTSGGLHQPGPARVITHSKTKQKRFLSLIYSYANKTVADLTAADLIAADLTAADLTAADKTAHMIDLLPNSYSINNALTSTSINNALVIIKHYKFHTSTCRHSHPKHVENSERVLGHVFIYNVCTY